MPTTLPPHSDLKYGAPRCWKAITSSGSARNVMRKSWSSPPKTWATVAEPTRQRVPTHAFSSWQRGNAVSTAPIRRTHSSGTSGRSGRFATASACHGAPTTDPTVVASAVT